MCNRSQFWLPCGLACVALIASVPGQTLTARGQDATMFSPGALVIPCGVLDRGSGIAYIAAGPLSRRTIQAIDVRRGGRVLRSTIPCGAQPLAVVADRLVALKLEGRETAYSLRFLVFEADTARLAVRSDPIALPGWVIPGIAPGHSFDVHAAATRDHVLVHWKAQDWYSGEPAPGADVERESRKSAEGLIEFRPDTGSTSVRSPAEATAIYSAATPIPLKNWLAEHPGNEIFDEPRDPLDMLAPPWALPGTHATLATPTMVGVLERPGGRFWKNCRLATFDRRSMTPGQTVALPPGDGPPVPTLDRGHLLIRPPATGDRPAALLLVFSLDRLEIIGAFSSEPSSTSAEARTISAAIYDREAFVLTERRAGGSGKPAAFLRVLSEVRLDQPAADGIGRTAWERPLLEYELDAVQSAALVTPPVP